MRHALFRLLAGLAVILACTRSAPAADEPAPSPSPAPSPVPRGLDLYFIDVQGGAATLIVTPEKESLLIDSGWPGLEDRDPKRIVHVLRDVAGCERLDHLVTTHWHIDHYGGVEGISRLVPIGRFWDRGLPEDNLPGVDFPDGPKPEDPLYLAYKKASEGKRKPLKAGDRLPLRGQVDALVLASGGKVVLEGERLGAQVNDLCDDSIADLPADHSDNARSLTLIFRLGAFDFLDCGDLTWNIEKKLVCDVDRIRFGQQRTVPDQAIDLYQVTHHGMDISNHPTLLRTIQPTVAVMNNGPRKGGSPATVKRLKALPTLQALYALHKNQATSPEDNADPAATANADPAGGQFIHVHVEPDGSAFTVRIGEDGPPRTFTTR
jgi:beta-lactamase superfamily II metal-dependent hydrolase